MPRISRSARLADLTAVVLDLETTGLDVSRDRIVQIGAVRVVDGCVRPTETFVTLVNPSMPIPPASTAIHGIDDAAVQSAPRFADVHRDLDAFLGDAVIVGQSVGFDLAILLRETRRIGAPWRPPHFLDTKLLYATLQDDPRDRSLDELTSALGISVAHRHTALDDALATAEIFARLIPLLAEKGIRTLGDAEAHSNALFRIIERQAREGWYDATSVRPAEAWIDGRDREVLAPLDPFLYRHRLRHVMRTPVPFMSPHATIREAARKMDAEGLGAVFAGDPETGRVWGTVTEQDILREVVDNGSACVDRRIETVMSETVASLPQDAFLYRGLALMQRRGIRHLVVTDAANGAVGLVSVQTLLGERAGQAIRLGDEISEANHPSELARAHGRLPTVARELLTNGVDAIEIARVLSFELRELVGRAAVLAERTMENEGAGRPPAPYALFVLGSGGRGESLLAPEQDNALVYDSADPEGPTATWFARFGHHVATILHDSGVSYCAEGVTVQSPAWQGNFDLWRDRFRRWADQPEHAVAEHADLLFDGHLAYGDPDLAAEFRSILNGETGGHRAFARALAAPALTPEIPPDVEGRIDLKRYALFPLTCAARALAVRHTIDAASTPERLAALFSAGIVTAADRDRLDEVQFRLKSWLLRQQIDDLESGRSPSKDIDVAGLPDIERQSLRSCFERIRELPALVGNGLL
jgi:DNA polymerase-3 subunit epsilon/CBS domain-containing protein